MALHHFLTFLLVVGLLVVASEGLTLKKSEDSHDVEWMNRKPLATTTAATLGSSVFKKLQDIKEQLVGVSRLDETQHKEARLALEEKLKQDVTREAARREQEVSAMVKDVERKEKEEAEDNDNKQEEAEEEVEEKKQEIERAPGWVRADDEDDGMSYEERAKLKEQRRIEWEEFRRHSKENKEKSGKKKKKGNSESGHKQDGKVLRRGDDSDNVVDEVHSTTADEDNSHRKWIDNSSGRKKKKLEEKKKKKKKKKKSYDAPPPVVEEVVDKDQEE